jgi:opacity protein-like surface antigen
VTRFFALAIAFLPAAALAEDYFGVLKVPQPDASPRGPFASFNAVPTPASGATADGYRMKLGYRYTRYFSLEGEFSDYARAVDPFAKPASLASAFRSTGFGVDTVATLPLWRFSFYGRMGAYHGDRNNFATYATTLLNDPTTRATRWRYGLGMRYDFTPSLGVRAEVERHSMSLSQPMAGDIDSDQVSVGVSWRF